MIEMKNVFAGYGGRPVLKGICMEAEAGAVTTVLGCNGCGKSTLLKTLIGLLPVEKGEIVIDGSIKWKPAELAKYIAYLPQCKNVPDITAGRFVLHGRFPYLSYPRNYTAGDYKIAEGAMAQMGIRDLWDVPLSELSGGMRQKVYIAMALAKQAPVIVMDEPTTYLDLGQQRLLTEIVKELAAQGKTVLLVLHDVLLALKISDRLCVMERGVISKAGTPGEVLQSGILRQLYGIDIGTVQTQAGVCYYCK